MIHFDTDLINAIELIKTIIVPANGIVKSPCGWGHVARQNKS